MIIIDGSSKSTPRTQKQTERQQFCSGGHIHAYLKDHLKEIFITDDQSVTHPPVCVPLMTSVTYEAAHAYKMRLRTHLCNFKDVKNVCQFLLITILIIIWSTVFVCYCVCVPGGMYATREYTPKLS